MHRCLIIADDLTGGADAGAQFAKTGLSTLLISIRDALRIDFSKYTQRDVLVINTDSRGLSPEKAFSLVSNLSKDYDRELFPIIYKKVDSTLRGNIGYEIDAILKETNVSLGFMAPSFPEQHRTVVGGIMMVGAKPLALTETANDAVSPVKESHVRKLLEQQSRHRIGRVDLTHVASSVKGLREAVKEKQKSGDVIILFDAVQRSDLTHIAEVAFCMDEKPLLIGSAGLAQEIAKKLFPSKLQKNPHLPRGISKPFKHIFIMSGSASNVTNQQLKRVEQRREIASFQLNKLLLMSGKENRRRQEENLSSVIGDALVRGNAIVKTCSERLLQGSSHDLPIHLEITKSLGRIAHLTLKKLKIDLADLALIIVGGDTAMSVLNFLGSEGVEIEGELMEGIVRSHLIGGRWDGLNIVTKAGAFGRENALEKTIEMLHKVRA
jgi:uncharacterized protein YgbK (DUF1537 family)